MNNNEENSEPILIDINEVVRTTVTPFLLHDSDFVRLTKVHNFLAIWAHSFFAGTSVFLVTLISKWVGKNYFESIVTISSEEKIALGILVLLVIVFEAAYFFLPSEKKKTVKRIQKHFDKYMKV